MRTIPVKYLTQYYTTLQEARSLSDRIQTLEQQMQEVLKRLEGLEGQAKSFDVRIGGGYRGRVSTPAEK